jgi:hypothetical protein
MRARALHAHLSRPIITQTGALRAPRPANRSFADPSNDINDEEPKHMYYTKLNVCTYSG